MAIVDGMACGRCKASAENSLTRILGVEAEVALDDRDVNIGFSTGKTNINEIRKDNNDAGIQFCKY